MRNDRFKNFNRQRDIAPIAALLRLPKPKADKLTHPPGSSNVTYWMYKTVVKRLMSKDMCSGWGIRTLSAAHPSFNPYNYQTGAVWPHDTSLIALGMRRYGFAAEAAAVARAISGAASHFLLSQLPELYAGLQRDPLSFPVQYVGANVPQAWAAGTPFMLLQAMLGLEQDAARGKLYIDPAPPDWLPDVTLTNLRLGRQRFDIRFWDGKDTLFKVLKGEHDAIELRSIAFSTNTPPGWIRIPSCVSGVLIAARRPSISA